MAGWHGSRPDLGGGGRLPGMGYNSTGLVVHDADAHIMEPPNWLRDHADPAIRERIEPLRYQSGNELRQTGDPGRAAGRPRRRLRPPRRPPPQRRVRRGRGGGDHEPQELRRHRFVLARGPQPRPRPARLRQPALVQHVPQPPPARLGARRRPRPGVRRRPRPQPRDGRVLLRRSAAAAGVLRAARRHRPGSGDGRRGDRDGRRRPARRLRLPTRPLPQPHRPRPRSGRRPARRASRSCSTSAAPATSSTRTTSATACRSRPTSTAARRTSARSTTWASPARRRRRWRR